MVFGITGSASVQLGRPFLNLLSLSPEIFNEIPLGNILYYLLRLIIIFPIYQVLLIFFGTIFLQFKFFWKFEKKMLRKMGIKI
tara:strand:- start:147 stop:395 length:249 start_codon:yes stop_codon:yes gene_type:complete